MAEKKLSDELRRCLEDDACGDCQYHKPETKFICKGLLQKAYGMVKRYEEMFPCKPGDKLYHVGKEPKRIREFTVRWLMILEDNVIIETEEEINFDVKHIGKDFFLTKEAAEKALKEMEDRKDDRLTRRELWWGSQGKTDKAVNYKVDGGRRCVTHEGSTDFLIADKLAEYEDLEEQGKLLKLPCVVGDMIYWANNWFVGRCSGLVSDKWHITESEVYGFFYSRLGLYIRLENEENFSISEIGKTVFLTRPEAERALAEMEGEK